MKKATLLIAFSALLTAHAAFASDIYFIDKNHSNVGFLIRHLFTKVPGRFTDFSGQIRFHESNPEQSTVEVTIKTASVNTDNDTRDKDLRSPNFLDVEKFPEMTFKSKSVKYSSLRCNGHSAGCVGVISLTLQILSPILMSLAGVP
jgi:polyisoprenoid-binding protein YceI